MNSCQRRGIECSSVKIWRQKLDVADKHKQHIFLLFVAIKFILFCWFFKTRLSYPTYPNISIFPNFWCQMMIKIGYFEAKYWYEQLLFVMIIDVHTVLFLFFFEVVISRVAVDSGKIFKLGMIAERAKCHLGICPGTHETPLKDMSEIDRYQKQHR